MLEQRILSFRSWGQFMSARASHGQKIRKEDAAIAEGGVSRTYSSGSSFVLKSGGEKPGTMKTGGQPHPSAVHWECCMENRQF
jgi:hypothetical protein